MLHQRLEKRRQQTIEILARRPRHLPGQERYSVFEQVKDAAQLIELGHGVGRGIFQGDLLAQGKDRQIRRPHPREADQFGHVLQKMRVGAGVLGGNQHARETMMGRSHQTPFRVVGGRNDTETFLFQLPGNASDTIAGDRVGLDVAMDDQHRKLQIFVHGAQCPEAADSNLPMHSG
ncbi:hypothetical protein PS718_05628 [Pseudomonas fluorescens]|uniref:Uncharacterized protein n=1 Tax=Pseudomonas fluorescens TaxID=294 RepID=A0A5E7FJE3_PSEFL|nr:hypothetical protein PS718_05595 [Pseudomonas fluorescens]VVO39019.1 hypothetical protein PS718_05627 [Pseudomonas fluorescens]VVO39034.1 hypothetical protein PS718_05628 [Pseudomonas fluorescens]